MIDGLRYSLTLLAILYLARPRAFDLARASLDDHVALVALGLSGGDTSGMWMLNYEFPYADQAVELRYERLTNALAKALDARGTGNFAHSLRDVKARWRELRENLSEEDYRYLQFQWWQEGVARYVELKVAERAASVSCVGGSAHRDVLSKMMNSLKDPSLTEQKRVAFYAAGAAIALLLDETSPHWKTDYLDRPFSIETYFAP